MGLMMMGNVGVEDVDGQYDPNPESRRSLSQPIKLTMEQIMEKLSMAPKEDLPKFTDSKMAAPFEGMLRSDSMHSFKDKRLLLKNAKMNTPGLLAQQRKMIKEKQLKEQKKKEAQELKQKMLIGRQTLIIREDDDEH